MTTAAQRATAQASLDLHTRMAAINPGAWTRPRTSRKRRYSTDNGLTRIEGLAQIAYDLRPQPQGRETSNRGDKWREQWAKLKTTVSEVRPSKYMHSHASRMVALPVAA